MPHLIRLAPAWRAWGSSTARAASPAAAAGWRPTGWAPAAAPAAAAAALPAARQLPTLPAAPRGCRHRMEAPRVAGQQGQCTRQQLLHHLAAALGAAAAQELRMGCQRPAVQHERGGAVAADATSLLRPLLLLLLLSSSSSSTTTTSGSGSGLGGGRQRGAAHRRLRGVLRSVGQAGQRGPGLRRGRLPAAAAAAAAYSGLHACGAANQRRQLRAHSCCGEDDWHPSAARSGAGAQRAAHIHK